MESKMSEIQRATSTQWKNKIKEAMAIRQLKMVESYITKTCQLRASAVDTDIFKNILKNTLKYFKVKIANLIIYL